MLFSLAHKQITTAVSKLLTVQLKSDLFIIIFFVISASYLIWKTDHIISFF